MTSNLKIKELENLESANFLLSMCTLLKKLGYNNVESNDTDKYIMAKFSSPVNDESHLFLYIEHKLTGTIDYEKITNTISEIRKKHFSASTLILSKFHLSNTFKETITKYVSNIIVWDRDEIIKKFDNVFPEFWKHDDVMLHD